MSNGEIEQVLGEDWVHNFGRIHLEFACAAWNVTGFQAKYAVWCQESGNKHMSTYDELFVHNHECIRIIETNLLHIKDQIKEDKEEKKGLLNITARESSSIDDEVYSDGDTQFSSSIFNTPAHHAIVSGCGSRQDDAVYCSVTEDEGSSIYNMLAAFVGSDHIRRLIL